MLLRSHHNFPIPWRKWHLEERLFFFLSSLTTAFSLSLSLSRFVYDSHAPSNRTPLAGIYERSTRTVLEVTRTVTLSTLRDTVLSIGPNRMLAQAAYGRSRTSSSSSRILTDLKLPWSHLGGEGDSRSSGIHASITLHVLLLKPLEFPLTRINKTAI